MTLPQRGEKIATEDNLTAPISVDERKELLLHEQNVLVVSEEVGRGMQQTNFIDLRIGLFDEQFDNFRSVLCGIVSHSHGLIAESEDGRRHGEERRE